MVAFSDTERLEFEEYIDFLKRCDLGSQYPKQNFEHRIRTVLKNVDICITARNHHGLLIGICFGITDFAYFLFLTDLGVDRDYCGQGIGKNLLARAHQQAGGEADITITTIAHERAIGFYAACGIRPKPELMVKYCTEWESFVVT
jgi:GNAT superfamily N-acetyltransferase